MFEEVREPLGPVGRFEGHARGHRSCDEKEFPLDRRRHAPRASPHDRIETLHRPIQSLQDGELRVPSIPVLGQQDDLSHGAIMRPPSDTSGRFRPRMPDQATRTEFTGASRS